jgi:alkyldihydroxyacetonephosphate synthase
VVASAPGAEEKKRLYQDIWKAALDACVKAKGSISHHHGIGKLKGPWMKEEWGETGLEALRALKRALDPQGIMNPGKLDL